MSQTSSSSSALAPVTVRLRTVLANGCFDPMHYGHILHLRAAKAMGERLVVSVTRNDRVKKGPHRPAVDEKYRADTLRELRCVDEVILVSGAMEALIRVQPDIFVKGAEYDGELQQVHLDFCKEHRIQIAFTNTPKFSSTDLLKHYLDRLGQS